MNPLSPAQVAPAHVRDIAIGIACLLTHFFAWLDGEARGRRLFFLSREGGFMQSLYRQTRAPSRKSAHLCLSRKIVSTALTSEPEMIGFILAQPCAPGRLWPILKERFSLADTDLAQYQDCMTDKLHSAAFLRTLSRQLFTLKADHGAACRTALRRYLVESGFEDDAMVVDIGYRGFMQHGINRICGMRVPGRYFLLSDRVFCKRLMQGMVQNAGHRRLLSHSRLFLEAVLTCSQQSADTLSVCNGYLAFTYKKQERMPAEINKIKAMVAEMVLLGQAFEHDIGAAAGFIAKGRESLPAMVQIEDLFGGSPARAASN